MVVYKIALSSIKRFVQLCSGQRSGASRSTVYVFIVLFYKKKSFSLPLFLKSTYILLTSNIEATVDILSVQLITSYMK